MRPATLLSSVCPSKMYVLMPLLIANTVTTPAATPNPPITAFKNVM
jgi:hypothetical protein